jgi:hypothetical protein
MISTKGLIQLHEVEISDVRPRNMFYYTVARDPLKIDINQIVQATGNDVTGTMQFSTVAIFAA